VECASLTHPVSYRCHPSEEGTAFAAADADFTRVPSADRRMEGQTQRGSARRGG